MLVDGASQQSKDHFSAAIVQSGSLDMAMLNNEKIKALPGLHQKYVNQLDCPVNTADLSTTIECLQHKSVDEIMANSDLFAECNSVYLHNYCIAFNIRNIITNIDILF